MIARSTTSVMFIAACLAATGCQSWGRREVVSHQPKEPPLPQSISRDELVAVLNRQNEDLNGWRSSSTKLLADLPGYPEFTLPAQIACKAPNYFRLSASNFAATADLGSNHSRCWAYIKPGEPAILTWKHEDTPLLQHASAGIPHIDPKWLMQVLGITPLNAEDFELQTASNGNLRLVAVEGGSGGRSVTRVVEVDRVRRVAIEHAVLECGNGRPIVVARLGNHRWKGNVLIPHVVKLIFPQMKAEMKLTFRDVETNPHLPDGLWHLPENDLPVVDLGDAIRRRFPEKTAAVAQVGAAGSTAAIKLQQPDFAAETQSAFVGNETFSGTNALSHNEPFAGRDFSDVSAAADETAFPVFEGSRVTPEIPEPDWSSGVSPISHSQSSVPPRPPAKRKWYQGWLGR